MSLPVADTTGPLIAVVLGTRPEAIKLAPVIRRLRDAAHAPIVVINTGQHRELLDPLLPLLDVAADLELDVMREHQPLSGLTARLMDGLGQVLRKHRPDAVLVQGDTTTALCGALAAFYARLPVGHVEAGLRSGVVDNPFPEELNRRLITPATHWHFAPTPRAAAALRGEGVSEGHIHVTGNTVIDNLLWTLDRNRGRNMFPAGCGTRRRILVTLHRRENQGDTMRGMAAALRRLADRGDVEIVLPLHRNPATRDALVPALADHSAITLTEALDYVDFVATLAQCDLVLTDSGGIQEEAPSLGKPVLVLRTTTERPEAIDAGAAMLIGTDPDTIVAQAAALLDDDRTYSRMATVTNPFGDGHAATRIIDTMLADL
jgi:UDP-N-acetylglucosamine 2-epimerase (non-hydrolysing)